MTERTIKIKELISGQVDMGTFGLVELELLAIEKEMEALRQPLVMVRSKQLCRIFFPDGKTTSATKCQFCGKEKWEH